MKVIKNNDDELAKEVLTKLKSNDGYCPCKLIKNEDTKCRCKEFREQLEKGIPGLCHCGLWMAIIDDEDLRNENDI